MKKKSQILIAIDAAEGRGRGEAMGAAQYAERLTSWECEYSLLAEQIPEALAHLSEVDGVVVSGRFCEAVHGKLLPVVAVGEGGGSCPRVEEDSEASGAMAANHLVERGLRNFGYYGYVGSATSRLRREGFASRLLSMGYSNSQLEFEERPGQALRTHAAETKAWLASLTKPVGILCGGDPAARRLALLCRELEILIPHEVAIVGVGEDELLCRMCRPHLSSVDVGSFMMGFEAARVLHLMLQGKAAPREAVRVEPVRVVTRESTDVLAVEDETVARAARYIREHLAMGVNVKQLVEQMKMGRRTLELAFRGQLGRTIHQEIVRVQLQRACELLANEKIPLQRVAAECGMSHRSHLGNFFRKHMGVTPLDYRRKYQKRFFEWGWVKGGE